MNASNLELALEIMREHTPQYEGHRTKGYAHNCYYEGHHIACSCGHWTDRDQKLWSHHVFAAINDCLGLIDPDEL